MTMMTGGPRDTSLGPKPLAQVPLGVTACRGGDDSKTSQEPGRRSREGSCHDARR